jgi:serine/threonine protein kinase
LTILIGIGTGIGLLVIVQIVHIFIKRTKKRRKKIIRERLFKQNHGLLLQQLISSNRDSSERLKIFTLEELEKATNKFDQTRVIGHGGHGIVYKGILSDQRVVAIKRSQIVIQREINEFINEVVILSQIDHRNVVKLYGCCLESEVPLLVYEFISNGTLFDHLHVGGYHFLSWEDRFRVMLEIARALAHLHSTASISVFHRDIKSSNVLLDDYLTAKVSDFGASRSIQIDQTGITTVVQGTCGYLDPEYYYTGRLTEKSDVYSFGVILAELLTRKKSVFSSRLQEAENLASYFCTASRENNLTEILDTEITEEENLSKIEAVANLAQMCLTLKGEDRPTMKEVETRLEILHGPKKRQVHPWATADGSHIHKNLILENRSPGLLKI